jgi:hypothetical protein
LRTKRQSPQRHAERLWLRNLMVAAAAALGVTMSSALGVLLFLR